MKRLILIFALVTGVLSSFAQTPVLIETTKVPVTVTTTFSKDYPNAGTVIWYSYDNGYYASYMQDNMETHVILDANGNIIGTEKQVEMAVLPSDATVYLTKTYPDRKNYDKVFMVSAPDGTTSYVVLVDKKRVMFDKAGKYKVKVSDDGEKVKYEKK